MEKCSASKLQARKTSETSKQDYKIVKYLNNIAVFCRRHLMLRKLTYNLFLPLSSEGN